MKTHSFLPTHTLVYSIALGASLLSSRAQIPWATEEFSRKQKVEVYGIGQYLHSDDTTFNGPYGENVTMKIDDTGLGGVGVAYHINDYLSIRSDFLFGQATMHAQGSDGTEVTPSQTALLQTGRVNLDYNVINRRLTPVLTAGIGYQYLEIDSQETYYVQGYHGSGYVTQNSYYHETDFTWNVGAGFRWNVTDQLFIKLMGGAQWLQYSGANNISTQIEGFFVIGWMF
ncbi:MAG: outer membrane beta-barrel protein [Verrucomicrobia bacterium]|nr:outer membrane beta-barrel protein [Verrucomicrobiota bacterium]